MSRIFIGLDSFAGIAAVAALAAMGGSSSEQPKRFRKYDKPIGPPYPASRQHRRALLRASHDALATIGDVM